MVEKKKATKKKAEKPKAHRAKKAGPKKEKAAKQAEELKKDALILSFRRGRHTQRTNQFLVEIEGADTRAKASLYIGKRVIWTSPGKLKKKIHGKITTTHGNNGVLRARFSRGLPGTAVGTRVELA
jgi:large subunit ribosomal protein L35Ae